MNKLYVILLFMGTEMVAMNADERKAALKTFTTLERHRRGFIVRECWAQRAACQRGDERACHQARKLEQEFYDARGNEDILRATHESCVAQGTRQACAQLVDIMRLYGVRFASDLFPPESK